MPSKDFKNLMPRCSELDYQSDPKGGFIAATGGIFGLPGAALLESRVDLQGHGMPQIELLLEIENKVHNVKVPFDVFTLVEPKIICTAIAVSTGYKTPIPPIRTWLSLCALPLMEMLIDHSSAMVKPFAEVVDATIYENAAINFQNIRWVDDNGVTQNTPAQTAVTHVSATLTPQPVCQSVYWASEVEEDPYTGMIQRTMTFADLKAQCFKTIKYRSRDLYTPFTWYKASTPFLWPNYKPPTWAERIFKKKINKPKNMTPEEASIWRSIIQIIERTSGPVRTNHDLYSNMYSNAIESYIRERCQEPMPTRRDGLITRSPWWEDTVDLADTLENPMLIPDILVHRSDLEYYVGCEFSRQADPHDLSLMHIRVINTLEHDFPNSNYRYYQYTDRAGGYYRLPHPSKFLWQRELLGRDASKIFETTDPADPLA